MEALQVGHLRRGQRVESDLLAAVGPQRIAGNLREHLEAVHELDPGAGLESLTRIDAAGRQPFVGGKTAAGKLAVGADDGPVVPHGGVEVLLLVALQVILGRLAKPLRDIDAVVGSEAGSPICAVAMDLLAKSRSHGLPVRL